jgi:hypothetical protein
MSGSRAAWLNGRIRAGLALLVVASLWRWLAHPSAHLSANLVDGVAGVLYGISIGCFLTGIRMNALRRTGRGSDPRGSAP